MSPSAVALNSNPAEHVLGDYKGSGPGLQMHSRSTVTPLRLFFANYVGLSGPFGIALTGNDDGIRRVEKQGVVRHLPLPQPRAVGLLRPATELNPGETPDEDENQSQGRCPPPQPQRGAGARRGPGPEGADERQGRDPERLLRQASKATRIQD